MRRCYMFKEDYYKQYMEAFNDYALYILYGSNILIGSDIEDEYKDIPVDN